MFVPGAFGYRSSTRVSLGPHAELLLEHPKRYGVDTMPIGLMADQFVSLLVGASCVRESRAPLNQNSLSAHTTCFLCVHYTGGDTTR